ncbi:MAG: hypothetical protein QJT80_04660 [Candidatus Thiocaldithrix dubininis]|uniref:Uncharacterized protein n=1 Tax=Candidatus Thiocaldithrix dubininis TaxID=3080823 RepID=A0AA95KJ87_9GAMM|nr:MAG: hypothetical protein QJT80_04660 [Candidatus Thiocaldithrix dubininis]
MDTSSVLSKLAPLSQPPLQELPDASRAQVTKFEDILNIDQTEFNNIDGIPKDRTPILQITPEPDAAPNSIHDAVMQKIGKVDGSYQGMLEDLTNMPKYSDSLINADSIHNSNELRSYPAVGDSLNNPQRHFDALLKSTENQMQASLDYQRNLSGWANKSQMWIAGMNVISSAMNQVAQGFKTLFRAAG